MQVFHIKVSLYKQCLRLRIFIKPLQGANKQIIIKLPNVKTV